MALFVKVFVQAARPRCSDDEVNFVVASLRTDEWARDALRSATCAFGRG